jgi:hypothetical protein
LTALGIGSLSHVPAFSLFRLGYHPSVESRDAIRDELTVLTFSPAFENAAAVSIAVAILLYIYIMGIAVIGISQRLRAAVSNDRPSVRLSRAMNVEHEYALKHYLEQAALSEAFDGLALVLVAFGVASLILTKDFGLIFVFFGIILFAGAVTMWRESSKRLSRFDMLLDLIEVKRA